MVDALTLMLLAAQHPSAAVSSLVSDEVDCAKCALAWVEGHVYYVGDLVLAPDYCDGVDCETCDKPMKVHTWTP